MKGVQKIADGVTATRKPAAADNPFLTLQGQISDQIIAALDAYRVSRDQMAEQIFFSFYGSRSCRPSSASTAAARCGLSRALHPKSWRRSTTAVDAYAAKLSTGGFDEALTRAVLYVTRGRADV